MEHINLKLIKDTTLTMKINRHVKEAIFGLAKSRGQSASSLLTELALKKIGISELDLVKKEIAKNAHLAASKVISSELLEFVQEKSQVRGLDTVTRHLGVYILEQNSKFQTNRFIEWLNSNPAPFLRIAVVHKGMVVFFCSDQAHYDMTEIAIPDGDVWTLECFSI